MRKSGVVGIVQSRMGASRLPNKMLLHLHGYPIVEWVYRRALSSEMIDKLVFAVPDTGKDDVLATYLKSLGVNVYRGSEADVVSRFYNAAKEYSAEYVVRICADNPLICGKEIDTLINFYFTEKCDYAYNHIPRGNRYPDGLGAEIVSFDVLETIHCRAEGQSQREHVFNYIWDNPDKFLIKTFDPQDESLAFPHIKLDIDTYDDYMKMLSIDLKIDMSDGEIIRLFREAL